MNTMINLLPASYRRQQIIRKRVIQWGSLICLVLLLGGVWHWYEMYEDRALAQQSEALERQYAPARRMMQQLVEMRLKLEQLQQQELVARDLEHQRSALALLAVISQTAQRTAGRVRVTKLELEGFQRLGKEATRSAQPAGLLLSGVSLDNPAVGELLDGLQDSGIFKLVELQDVRERGDADLSLREYEVRCEF